MSEALRFRSGHIHERGPFLALADLLRDIFDIDITLLDRFGGPEPSAMPFAWFDGEGRCVANFSAFPLPLVVDGRTIRAAGFQSGAVRPEHRGRGLYRDLMERAFAWADASGFEAGLLLTDKPDLYRAYGFEPVPQHCFRGPMPGLSGAPNARLLSLDDAGDLALVTDTLESRSAVSQRFAACRQTKAFLLNACFDREIRLSHLPGLDAVVAWKEEGGTLRLLDVAARRMPELDRIVPALGVPAHRVEVLFPPDRLGWDGAAAAYHGSCVLMVRPGSAAPVPAGPFMLSPMAEF